MKSEYSILIARPVEEVFAYMDDVTRESEWQPKLREASKEPPGPTAVGTRKSYVSEFLGKRVTNTYVTTIFEPNGRVVYETTPDSSIAATTEITWAAASGGTVVTMSVDGEPRGALRFVPEAVLSRAYREEISGALERLKELLEGG